MLMLLGVIIVGATMLRNICIFTILLLCSSGANAVVVGDKDWLQLTSTTGGNSWNDFDAIFDTATGACDVAICNLGSLDLTEYTWASNYDVDNLFISYHGGAGLPSHTSDSIVYLEPPGLDQFFADFDSNVDEGNIIGWTRGTRFESSLLGDYIGALDCDPGCLDIRDRYLLETHARRDFSPTYWDGFGGWLYKDVNPIPVPAAVWLFGTALIGLVRFSK